MVIENRKINKDYTILETFEAGIELTGAEVKAIKANRASLNDSYARIKDGEAYLVNAYIAPYMGSADDPHRQRKLLLTRRELSHLSGQVQSGLTLVPKKLYNVRNWIKVQIALVRGKKQYEKRDTLRKRAIERDIQRELRGKNQESGNKN